MFLAQLCCFDYTERMNSSTYFWESIMKKLLFLSLLFFCLISAASSHILDQETTIQNYFKKTEIYENHSGLRNIDCVYVINLDKRIEKWERTYEQLSQYGIRPNRFSGIHGWSLEKEILDQFWTEQNSNPNYPKVPPGKLGCILSHLSVLQDAYDRGFNCIWIFQDDIDVYRDLKLMDSYIDKINRKAPDWGLLYADLDMKSYDRKGECLKALCITGAY